ncbi:phosphotransferase enzyme family protein [Pseudomassariella vexata]|uniref:Phosphotransferase enzyme family protein n=1 Tax=Pseudomassariella vexata TaxID=1141098 RepID=A0A1Y2E4I1_9PEZI|nr:phosphotransferase enzyme family protein [Pseudomassariella vexata]ORY66461.1 phosphotransferase enzyme family protein [Pseudomassariella vexata]
MAGRVRHPIDVSALEKYIAEQVPEIKVPLEVTQFGFGQSNPTYQLTSPSGDRYVLRKKPPGKLLSKAAHKVEREYRIIAALGPTSVPVPKAYCLCEDASIIGTPFYIMSFLDGRIIVDPSMPDSPPQEREALYKAATTTLAKLHSVDFRSVGLSSFGKPSGFYDRQLATWRQICDAQAGTVDVETGKPVGAIPHTDELLEFFNDERLRPVDRGTLIHGDYKIDNLVFHAVEPRVIGILDWEMSTVGHPLSDLANMMNPFYTSSMPRQPGQPDVGKPFRPGATSGLPTPEKIMAWYRDEAGWDPVPEMNWAVAFSVFRSSAICQGIAARVATRQASSEQARQYGDMIGPYGEFAWSLVEKVREKGSISAKL